MRNASATAGVQADEEQHKLNAGARRVAVVGAERHQRVQGTHGCASEFMRMSTTLSMNLWAALGPASDYT